MSSDNVSTLADVYPVEQQRIRELLEQYRELRGTPGVNVEFAIAAITAVAQRAEKSAAEHDTVAMLRSLAEMRECS